MAGERLSEALRTKYGALLLERMSLRGVPHHWIERAILTLNFEHREATTYTPIAPPGEPFLIQLRVQSIFAKTLLVEREGYCWPHSPSHESRRACFRLANEQT